ncbi:hypothetical protein BASA81_016524 [Batrachochytrium salamandrivorans]|nr:hypothetical protein BASA81_016524 [Batrachochytrium salamandrivorans]
MILLHTKRYSVFETTPERLGSPIVLKSKVVRGFGRGGKQLGCPTANLEENVLGLEQARPGVYFGWAKLGEGGEWYKCVASVGWNPFFQNEKKTCEPHLLHEFTEDFYGSEIEIRLCGRIRDEKNFPSLQSLIDAIQWDIQTAKVCLELDEFKL